MSHAFAAAAVAGAGPSRCCTHPAARAGGARPRGPPSPAGGSGRRPSRRRCRVGAWSKVMSRRGSVCMCDCTESKPWPHCIISNELLHDIRCRICMSSSREIASPILEVLGDPLCVFMVIPNRNHRSRCTHGLGVCSAEQFFALFCIFSISSCNCICTRHLAPVTIWRGLSYMVCTA